MASGAEPNPRLNDPVVPNLSADELAEATAQWNEAATFPTLMKDLGLELKPGSRFWNYHRYLVRRYPNAPHVPTLVSEAEIRRFGTMGLEMRRMLAAARHLGHLSEWKPLLRQALGGKDLPSDGGDHRPRDHQFHAYIAAVLARSGNIVRHSEPDIVLEFERIPLGVAVKRAGSRANLPRLIEKGFAQISARGFSGLVVVDVSRFITPYDNVLVTTNSKGVVQHVGQALGRLVDDVVPEGVKSPFVLGTALFATVMSFDRTLGCMVPCTHWTTCTLWPRRDSRSFRLRRFHEHLRLAEMRMV